MTLPRGYAWAWGWASYWAPPRWPSPCTNSTQLGFDWSINAYASIFYTLGGFLIALLACGVGMCLLVSLWAWRDEYTRRRCVAVGNLVWYWYALLAGWLVGFGTLYLGPLLVAGQA